MKRVSFYEEIRKNKIKSVVLVAVVFIVLMALTSTIALAFFSEDVFFNVMIFGTFISIIYIISSWNQSTDIILKAVKAVPAEKDEHKNYYNIVEGIAIAAGMPMPKLYIMEDEEINAFATGNNPEKAIICVTSGALQKLTKQQFEGVIAHEMSHIANYDIRFMGLVSVLIGLISIFSQMFLRGFGHGSSGSNNKNSGIFFALALVLAIISPIIVSLVQLTISRKREYLADSSAVKFVRSPTGLIGALKKIEEDEAVPKTNNIPASIAPLFISKPKRTFELFQTHPSIEKRIALLKKM